MLFPYRAAAWVSALLGAFGLLLSSIGLFGVVAFGVARRTREFGIRMALGETARGIVRMVLVEQLRVIALSIAIGLALGLAVARMLSSVVFGISLERSRHDRGRAALARRCRPRRELSAGGARRQLIPSVALREE